MSVTDTADLPTYNGTQMGHFFVVVCFGFSFCASPVGAQSLFLGGSAQGTVWDDREHRTQVGDIQGEQLPQLSYCSGPRACFISQTLVHNAT